MLITEAIKKESNTSSHKLVHTEKHCGWPLYSRILCISANMNILRRTKLHGSTCLTASKLCKPTPLDSSYLVSYGRLGQESCAADPLVLGGVSLHRTRMEMVEPLVVETSYPRRQCARNHSQFNDAYFINGESLHITRFTKGKTQLQLFFRLNSDLLRVHRKNSIVLA